MKRGICFSHKIRDCLFKKELQGDDSLKRYGNALHEIKTEKLYDYEIIFMKAAESEKWLCRFPYNKRAYVLIHERQMKYNGSAEKIKHCEIFDEFFRTYGIEGGILYDGSFVHSFCPDR